MKTIEIALALIGTGLQVYLCLLLLRHHTYKQVPFFFAFTSFSVVSAIIGLAAQNVAKLYFFVYWISEAFYLVLAFFSLQEAVRLVFRNFYTMLWFRLLFPAIGISILGIVWIRMEMLPRAAYSLLTVAVLNLEIAVGLLQFAIFCIFVLLIRFFHIKWRQHSSGIVLGFGVTAANNLVVYLLRSEFGTKFEPIVRIASPSAYIIVVLIWLMTFLTEETVQAGNVWDSALTPEQMIAELKRHTQTVKGILGR
jgi:hypothetical protein